jgi:N-acetylmuramoyl-L-alanine amidase
MQNVFDYYSLNFATHVQDQFRERVGRIDRGVRRAGFMVLWQTTMPSVLIEVGFISNAEEERYLMSEAGQNYIASAIFRAFRDYKVALERKSDALFASSANVNNGNNLQVSTKNTLIETGPAANGQSGNSPADRLIFKVQIGSSRNKIPAESDFFKGLENIEVFEADGLFKYVVGNAATIDEINSYRKVIAEKFPDAFLVAVRGGTLISIQEALTKN